MTKKAKMLTKIPMDVPLLLIIPEFPYKTVSNKPKSRLWSANY